MNEEKEKKTIGFFFFFNQFMYTHLSYVLEGR